MYALNKKTTGRKDMKIQLGVFVCLALVPPLTITQSTEENNEANNEVSVSYPQYL